MPAAEEGIQCIADEAGAIAAAAETPSADSERHIVHSEMVTEHLQILWVEDQGLGESVVAEVDLG